MCIIPGMMSPPSYPTQAVQQAPPTPSPPPAADTVPDSSAPSDAGTTADPKSISEEAQKRRADEKRRILAMKGHKSTIVTGPGGLLDDELTDITQKRQLGGS